MQQSLLQLAIFAAEQLIKHAPELFSAFRDLITRQDVTVEELQAERMRIASQTYEQLVPHTQLPPAS